MISEDHVTLKTEVMILEITMIFDYFLLILHSITDLALFFYQINAALES